MAKPFDPYHRWLGIRPEEQPASRYRLLGLAHFEDDLEVIRDASERQMSHVRKYALGAHSDLSQRILNELAAARACLLNSARKAEYDRRLRAELDAVVRALPADPQPVAAIEPARPEALVVALPAEPEPLVTALRAEPDLLARLFQRPAVYLVVGGVLLLLLIVLLAWALQPSKTPSAVRGTSRPYPAVYQVKVDPPDASLTAEGAGIQVQGSGRSRTVTVSAPDGKHRVTLVVAMPGYETRRHPFTPRPGDSEMILLPLKPLPTADPAPATPAEPQAPPLEKTVTNSLGMELVLIPSGEFVMGQSADEVEGTSRTPSQHLVRVTKSFYLARCEVTQEQFEKVMGWNRSGFSKYGDAAYALGKRCTSARKVGDTDTRLFPVEFVTWDEAVEFCRRLSEKEGRAYRLPTEAEWEYACRAGTTSAWYCGNSERDLRGCAWYNRTSGGTTHPVGQKKPNSWGLFDMHGNVGEWCSDWYDEHYYEGSPAVDPKGPESGKGHVIRGGSWPYPESMAKSGFRYVCSSALDAFGFRVAMTATTSP